MKYKLYLLEKSFEQQDIPRTFRVVIELDYNDPARSLKKLANMKLEGIKGISDKNDIAFSWLGIARDAMLIMKGNEVVKLNKISRVLYKNPHYLLSNNMFGLKRIWNKSESNIIGLMNNIFKYYFEALVKNNIVKKYDVQHTAVYQNLAYKAKKYPSKINGVKDFVKYFRKLLEIEKKHQKEKDWTIYEIIRIAEDIENTSDSKLQKAVYDMAEIMESIYGDEGEWIIKDTTLKIPKESYLYILITRKEYEKYMKMKKEDPQQFKIATRMGFAGDMIEKYEKIHNAVKEYGLDKKYKVKFIDKQEWDRIKSIHFAKKDSKKFKKENH